MALALQVLAQPLAKHCVWRYCRPPYNHETPLQRSHIYGIAHTTGYGYSETSPGVLCARGEAACAHSSRVPGEAPVFECGVECGVEAADEQKIGLLLCLNPNGCSSTAWHMWLALGSPNSCTANDPRLTVALQAVEAIDC